MKESEVECLLGRPDRATKVEDPSDLATVVEWEYVYSTPFTMYIVPTMMLFTIILTIPSLELIMGLGMSHHGVLWVGFGVDGKVTRPRRVEGVAGP